MVLTGGKTPTAAVEAWNMHIRAVLNDHVTASDLTQLGLDVQGCTLEEARAAVDKTIATWKSRMEAFGVAAN